MKTNLFKQRMTGLLLPLAAAIASTTAPDSQAAIIGADGGITLYISYNNTDVANASWNDMITQVNATASISCDATNNGRALQGAPNSPGQCPVGDTCLGRAKLSGDLQRFAEYIFEATEGRHYLRRVYLSDSGRGSSQADIRWNVGGGSSSSPYGWNSPGTSMSLNSGSRRCIHDVVHHEFGHYFYHMPDKYARGGDYYYGTIGGGTAFQVTVDAGGRLSSPGGQETAAHAVEISSGGDPLFLIAEVETFVF